MPRLKDGTIVRARYTKLGLGELSAVDRPAQPGATMAIMKRDDGDDSAEKISPFTDALSQSISAAVTDKRLSGDERTAEIEKSVASFLSSIREMVSKKDGPMPKSIEQLEADLAKVSGELTDTSSKLAVATGQVTELTARAEKAESELETAKADLLKATDEVLKIDENTEVKKSEVGEAQFKVTKSLVEKAEMATFEKRADTDFRHVVGKTEDKAKALKAIAGIADEDTRKAVEAIVQSAENMAKQGFGMIGGNGGVPPTEEQSVAKRDFDAEVQKNIDAGMKRTEAMSKARRDHADLFAKSQGDEAAAQ